MDLITRQDRCKLLKVKRRRAKEKHLVDYCVKEAKEQLREGRHFIIENPSKSRSWREVHSLRKLTEKAEELRLHWIQMDQCMTGLRGPVGGLIRKRTWFLTSSEEVAEELKLFQCSGDHEHEWCIGGKKITAPAGHYSPALSAAIVNGLERQRGGLWHLSATLWSAFMKLKSWQQKLLRMTMKMVRCWKNHFNLDKVMVMDFLNPKMTMRISPSMTMSRSPQKSYEQPYICTR